MNDRQTLLAEASRLIAAGDHQAAIPTLRALLKHDRRVEVYLNLALAQIETGALKEALESYHEALAHAPADPRLLNNIALISARLGAAEIYDAAALTAQTWNAIGMSAYFRGDFARARADLEEALKVDPEFYAAYNNISDLIEPDEAEVWIDRARALSPDAPEDRAAIAFLIAHLEDQRGNWAAAAAAWAEGGAAKRASFSKPFDPATHAKLIDSVIEAFDGEALRRLQTGSAAEARHIFVVGMPRSGSTLTSRMIGGDPMVRDMGEDRRLARSVIEVLTGPDGARAPFTALTRDSAAEIYDRYIQDLPPGPLAHLNKYPESYLFLGLIWAAFPNARVIDTRRDRYDTLISCYSKNFTSGNAWSYRPEDIAAYHADYLRLMAHWARVLPPEMLAVSDYDALTADPRGATERLCAHCGLDAAAALAADHRKGGAVETASAKQIRGDVKQRDPSRYAGYRPHIDFGPAPAI